MRRQLILALVVIIGLALAAPLAAQAQTAPTTDYENLIVVEVKELDITATAAYLSPDGQRIAALRGTRDLAIYDAEGNELLSVDLREAGLAPDPNSIRWSPDSTRLTMTENFFRNFIEPDIWVMDASTGKATNLTDDQETRYRPGQPANALDVLPAWTPDSKRLYFIRFSRSAQSQGVDSTSIYSIDAAGGTPNLEGILGTPTFSVLSLSVSPDGKQIGFGVAAPSRDEATNGMWVATPDGLNGKQLLKQYGLTDVRFSADGRYVLGEDFYTLGAFGTQLRTSTSLVASVEERVEVRVDDVHGAHWAAWSPTGAALAYLVRNVEQPDLEGLYVVPEPGKPAHLAYQFQRMAPPAPSTWLMPTWASNNTLLVSLPARKFLLLRFGTGL